MIGDLLIAHPLLNDSFFNRAVICITQNEENSVVGFIINFKTQFKLRDVRPQVINGNFAIYDGGPVGKNQLFFLHTLGNRIAGSIHIKDDLYFGGDFEQLLYLIDHEFVSDADVRFFAGYSGWESEQLVNELAKDSWFINKTPLTDVFKYDPFVLWGVELEKQKKSFGLFGDFGFDVSQN